MTTLKEKIKSEPGGVISRAYRLAEKAHAGQKRKNNDPYFLHVKATAEILCGWRLDDASIAAGLLHDVVEDTSATLAEIESSFGEEIAFLVDGVTKLGRIKYRGVEGRVENLRKMIFALSQDLRVVFIKLADRLHNMRTLSALPPQKQKRIALETDEIYAPIAYRLGMQNLSGELHDLAFPYLHPGEFRWLKEHIREEYAEREKYLSRLKPVLEQALAKVSIKPQSIDFRAKRHSSLYHKLRRYEMDISKIYDLVAMRVIVADISECYAVLGIVHQIWPPLPGRIKDYIAMPKPNGYRSLHTTVIGPNDKFVEIQIRTQQMHEENENGIAAHWLYEQVKSGKAEPRSARQMTEEVQWVQQLRRWQEKYSDVSSGEFLDSMKVDFFRDRIFAITPEGDVIDLPKGATPVDFAYEIHTAIGNTCVGAKVNDQFVPLDRELQSGDLVLILTQKNKKPSEEWLKFVKTSMAREHIRAALREKHRALRAVSAAPSRVEFRMVIENRLGLLKDISGMIAQSHFNIESVNTLDQPSGNFPVLKVLCEGADKKKIEKLVLKLKKLREVKEISYELV